VVFWLSLTIIGGFGFLSCQAYEWYNLIAVENMTVFENPFGTHTVDGVMINADGSEGEAFRAGDSYLVHKVDGEWQYERFRITSGEDSGKMAVTQLGPQTFGSLFFCITGFHGFHVSIGLILLITVTINAASGLYDRKKTQYETVEKIGLYWHFVDLVWVFVFLVFYLL
jgi:cytochrome c oxidase subunit 3